MKKLNRYLQRLQELTERDGVTYLILHPTTGQVLAECDAAQMPAELLKVIQSIGKSPRIQIVDAQKAPV